MGVRASESTEILVKNNFFLYMTQIPLKYHFSGGPNLESKVESDLGHATTDKISKIGIAKKIMLNLDINECQNDPCGQNADCVNKIATASEANPIDTKSNGYECKCQAGYEGDPYEIRGEGCKGKIITLLLHMPVKTLLPTTF